MSVEALKEYILRSKYARYNRKEKRRESYAEATNRVRDMMLELYPEIVDEINKAYDAALDQKVLGSQRALQFGGRPALQHNSRVFNCTASYCDRLRFFQEAFYLLLCGCGTGFSVQKHHIAKLPRFNRATECRPTKIFVIPDNIEGWADSLGVLLSSYFENPIFPAYVGFEVEFDFSLIRPEGSYLSSGAGKAPGPAPLKRALEKICGLLDRCVAEGRENLRPIDAYDIVMHASDAVLAGGVRRSACICIFSADDYEMATAKTGDWFETNPQRGRSNNSALLLRNATGRQQFKELMGHVRQWGEPGVFWSDNTEQMINPCTEAAFWPRLLIDHNNPSILNTYQGPIDNAADDPAFDKDVSGLVVSGWQKCNLSSINGGLCKTPEDFYEACEYAAIIGTCQAGMVSFPYLGHITELIVRKEALLGVSITAVMDSPDVLLNPQVLRKGASIVLATNEKIAKRINVNPSARATLMKPEGTGTLMLGSLACGLRPWHSKKVLRQVQANRTEPVAGFFKKHNPWAVEKSKWCQNGTTNVLTFCVEAPETAILSEQIDTIQFLKNVEIIMENWVRPGKRPECCTRPWLGHSVSNTVVVKPDEWDAVEDYIYDHRENFVGVSLLPFSGDRDYPQAPFVAVYTLEELYEKYGDKDWVDASWSWLSQTLPLYDYDVFSVCDAMKEEFGNTERGKQMPYILKDLYYLARWNDLKESYQPVNYNELIEDNDTTCPQAEVSCAGGACLI